MPRRGCPAVTIRSLDDCVTMITCDLQGVRCVKRERLNPGGIPHPPTPPGSQEPQVEATTCRNPGSVDCPGFIFVAVNERSEIIFRCCCAETSVNSHCAFGLNRRALQHTPT